ncbi:hypothetical protein SAMN04488510_10949 [Fervidobacterium changbaicum]|uniref:Uncharacterized protein n=1 Tax=Fervidobacterium changbaicum TaxID=310769 RepID=A0AAE6CEC7_9BACT|nr:hypothetical protein [Fervidobacterium changbaicum]QAV33983.1 hypothetical protein CBS1_09925 [Fervidobacterium changbaicum]SDH25681.1 hypothetical protein SAMN04488510_10949 [Fervidobacterium changbaicum]
MRKLLLVAVLLVLSTVGLSFIGVEAANLQEQMYELYARFDAGILAFLYPVGYYDFETQEFSLSQEFNVENLYFGLNLKLPLSMFYLRGAAYTTVGDVMSFTETNKLGIFGRVGAGIDLFILSAEAGVRIYYLFGDPEFETSFNPSLFYVALGLSF